MSPQTRNLGVAIKRPQKLQLSSAAPTHAYAPFTKTLSAPWVPRDGARVEFFNGLYWLMGGWNPANNPEWGTAITTNSVWSSPDLVTWTERLTFDPAPPTSGPGARWTPRHTFMSFVRQGKLWVANGDNINPPPVPSDVWNSPDGITWTRVAPSSPWGPAYLAIPGNYNGRMHVMGGSTNPSQHWSSDDGVTWTQHPDMPFDRQAVTNAVVLDGLMFIIGGLGGDGVTEHNDCWAFNGATWTQQSADGAAPWNTRYWIATAAYDEKLWVMTGKHGPSNEAGLWSSSDYGVTWTPARAYPWLASHADGVTVTLQDGIVIASGNGGLAGPGFTFAYNVKAYVDPSTTMSTLAWRLWFDGTCYTPMTETIAGLASAGDSAAKVLQVLPANDPTKYPTMGDINGLPTLVLNSANLNFLSYVAGGGVADIIAAAHWTVVFVGKINASPSNAAPYLNPALGNSSDADWAIDFRSNNVLEAYQFVGGVDKIAATTWAAGVLVLVQARYDGVNISIRIGKGAWVNTASAASAIAGGFTLGANYNHTNFGDLELCEYAATDVAISDADLDKVADDMHAKWGVVV